MYYDAHIHLMDKDFLIEAQKKGVHSFIINATTPNEWEQIISLSYQIDNLYPCIGIHPWFVKNLEQNWAQQMESLLKKYPFVMVGEIGLDYLKADKDIQLYVFETCLKLAQKYHRPAHIHVVKAWHDILKILKNFSDEKFLFHQFNASNDIIQKLKKFDSFFSVSSRQNIEEIPSERLLVETDSPSHNKLPVDIINFVKTNALNKKQLHQNFQKFVTPFNQIIPMKEK